MVSLHSYLKVLSYDHDFIFVNNITIVREINGKNLALETRPADHNYEMKGLSSRHMLEQQ